MLKIFVFELTPDKGNHTFELIYISNAVDKVRKISVMLLGQGLNALIALLMMPYLARSFSKIDYASYGQSLLVVLTISSIIIAVFNKSLYLFLAHNPENSNRILSGNLLVSSFLAFVACSLLWVSAPSIAMVFGNEDLIIYIQIYSLSLPFSVNYNILNYYLIFNGRIKASSSISVLSNSVKVILLLVAIHFYGSVTYVFIALLISSAIQCLLVYWASRDIRKLTFSNALRIGIAQGRIGIPLGLSAMMGTLILQADGFMVSTMLDQTSYATYRNGAWEIPLISTIYASISTIILPEIAKLFAENKLREILNLKSVIISNTAAITFPLLIFIILNSNFIIELLFSKMYNDSWPVFAIFNLTLLIRVSDYSDVIISSGKTRYISTCYFISLVVNLSLNWILIRYFGIYGAAVATFLALLLLAALQTHKTLELLKTSFAALFRIKTLMTIFAISLLSYGFSFIVIFNIPLEGITRIVAQGVVYIIPLIIVYKKCGFIHPKILSNLKLKSKFE